MERERDESEKPTCAVLLFPQAEQMVDPLLVRLDVPVQHRAMRRDTEPVRRVVHVEPDVGMLLARGDEPPYALGEDLRAAPRQRPEPGVLELAQDLLVRKP